MRVTKEELLQELKVLMEDEFVAEIKEEDEKISLKFLSGQKFYVEISEAQ